MSTNRVDTLEANTSANKLLNPLKKKRQKCIEELSRYLLETHKIYKAILS